MAPPAPDRGAMHHGTEKDHEGEMARSQLMGAQESAAGLLSMIQDGDELPAWLQSKLTKAHDYLTMAQRYLQYKSQKPSVSLQESSEDIADYPEAAVDAAKHALEQMPHATLRHAANLENEIYTYLEEGFSEIKQPEEIFKLADDALSVAGIMMGVGPDAL